jgi:G3E family GTPase
VDLLVDQIEFADVIVLNKVADAGPDRRDAAVKIIKALNPVARLVMADRGVVEPAAIMGTGLFDMDRAQDHPLWVRALHGQPDQVPETEEYGVSSFVYRARRPFDPARVHAVLNGDLPGVIRAKGHFWLATRPDWVAEFSLAGALSSVTPLGLWWAAVPRDHWPDPGRAMIESVWAAPFGDRRQEIVFIGAGMDRAAISAALDACLVGEEMRFAPEALAGLKDPFPDWRRRTG